MLLAHGLLVMLCLRLRGQIDVHLIDLLAALLYRRLYRRYGVDARDVVQGLGDDHVRDKHLRAVVTQGQRIDLPQTALLRRDCQSSRQVLAALVRRSAGYRR